MRSAMAASATPTIRRRAPAGLASGPRMLNTVGTPSSRRVGTGVAHRGVEPGREAEPDAGLATRTGPPRRARSRCARRAPRARRRCRSTTTPPGCRACTRAPPAPATTRAASVETLIVWARSPPVPTMSTTSTTSAAARPARRRRAWPSSRPVELVDRLALHAQGDDEPGDLGRRRRPVEDLGHRRLRPVGRQVAALTRASRGRPATPRTPWRVPTMPGGVGG